MSGRQGKDFTIDCNGQFKSAGTAERVTVEVRGPYLEKDPPGDVLLSVYCSLGSIVVEIDGLIYAGKSSYNLFGTGGGLPLTGQYTGPIRVTTNASESRVYVVYEKYDTLDRELLASYRSPYDVSYGIKLKDPRTDITYQVKNGNLETY